MRQKLKLRISNLTVTKSSNSNPSTYFTTDQSKTQKQFQSTTHYHQKNNDRTRNGRRANATAQIQSQGAPPQRRMGRLHTCLLSLHQSLPRPNLKHPTSLRPRKPFQAPQISLLRPLKSSRGTVQTERI